MTRQQTNPTRIFSAALALATTLGLTACGIFDEGDPPTKARVTVEGGGGASIHLVTSNDFSVTSDDGGETRDIFFYSQDTISITPPYDEQLPLGSAQRIFVRASTEETLDQPVTMRVFLSGEERYSASSTLGDIRLEFLYTYR